MNGGGDGGGRGGGRVWKGWLRALEDAWDAQSSRAVARELQNDGGKPRAPEWWPESSRRGLELLLRLRHFLLSLVVFFVLRRLQVAPGGVELCPRRSLEFRGRP